MSMKNKYYTPKIESFHIGFEFEEEFKNPNWRKLMKPLIDTCGWVNLKLDTSHSISRITSKLKQNKVRVKYLDQSDLIELGWTEQPKSTEFKVQEGFWRVRILSEGEIELDYEDNVDWESSFTLYKCKVKNKSEMLKLMKMLSIKTPINKL